MADPFNLQRFVEAQAPVYAAVVRELATGAKRSHWMWFVFPQIAGLGLSPTSVFYAVSSRDEARAYLAHPILGPRLVECANLVLAVEGRSVREIFGAVDAMKFRSCLTLFGRVAPEQAVFAACLDKYFAGEDDPATLAKLGR